MSSAHSPAPPGGVADVVPCDVSDHCVNSGLPHDRLLAGAVSRAQSVFDANFESMDASGGVLVAALQPTLWQLACDCGCGITSGMFPTIERAGATRRPSAPSHR